MQFQSYPCPGIDGAQDAEMVLTFDQGRKHRVLVIPALFDEANKLRRLTVEVMRRLDGAGIDAFLPDLPGCNESLRDLATVAPDDWRSALAACAAHFGVNRVLAIRGGILLAPQGLAGWHYGPVKGASLLRQLLRARILAVREAGGEETIDGLLETGKAGGLELGGYSFSPAMLAGLQAMAPEAGPRVSVLDQELVGGSPLWLRAEPAEDPDQADAIAAVITMALAA